ncbi:MAG: glutathione S-transferase family protein [Minwuia sp.]|uniref:glutathione S-transferase family protein n=1 Tax=Minwuia sp. TaxID=2493630 RepID=UPI003A87993D
MKLFYTQNSPYARRPRLVARTARLEIEEVDMSPLADRVGELLDLGPGGKVPGLLTDSGVYLTETLLITRYLNDAAGGKLTPREADRAEKVLEMEGIGSLLMDSLFTRSHEKRRDDGEKSQALIDKEGARAARCYDALNERLTNQPTVLDFGTIAAISALGYADWRHADDNWREGRPGLANWFNEMMVNPAVAETAPKF